MFGTVYRVVSVFLGATLILLWLRNGSLSNQLEGERAAHERTRVQWADAVREGNRWRAAASAAERKLPPLQEQVRECQAREQQAQADAAERDNIMADMVPVVPEEKKDEVTVVDTVTRKKAMARLNRSL